MPSSKGILSCWMKPCGSQPHNEMEDDVGNLVGIGQFWGGSFGFFGGLGVFFMGVAFLWFVSIYKEKNDKE